MEKKELELLTELSVLQKCISRKLDKIPVNKKEEFLKLTVAHFRDLNKKIDKLLDKDI